MRNNIQTVADNKLMPNFVTIFDATIPLSTEANVVNTTRVKGLPTVDGKFFFTKPARIYERDDAMCRPLFG